MPSETLSVLVSVLAVSLLSVVGALLLLRRGRVRRLLPLLIALAAGALLGDTFLHLLPHAVHDAGRVFDATISYGVLAGLVGFFLIEGVLHWHHHGEDVHEHGPEGVHSLGWMNLIGDGLHNLIDGMLIAAAWLVGPEAGIATTVAVALHEIPQEFGDFGVLLHAGFTPRKAILFNLLSGMAALVGAVIVLLLAGDHGIAQFLVPVAAGGFLYIACADLVPEMRKPSGETGLPAKVLALVVGIALMAAVHAVEGGHDHAHDHGGGPGHHGHDHGDDGHDGHAHDGDGQDAGHDGHDHDHDHEHGDHDGDGHDGHDHEHDDD